VFPILHHYEISPFSEKVRRIFAFKRIAHHSVRAPAIMPKPDLLALTGGYRRIPVLQMGNHVYCDTSLIARVLERVQPTPTLYPTPLAETLAEWADSALFGAAIPVGMHPSRFDDLMRMLTPDELSGMMADRAAMHGDAKRGFLPPSAARTHLPAYLARLEAQLAGTPYLLGDAPSIADFSVYHALWFLQLLRPEPLEPFAKVREFMDRIRAIPDFPGDPLPSAEALEICRRAGHREGPVSGPIDSLPPEPGSVTRPTDAAGNELRRGQRVVVRAVDYARDPVEGDLVLANDQEFAVRREDPRAGNVIVHFPVLGYELQAR
jgi:glutathione S-transferase